MKNLHFIALLALPCLAQAQTLNDYQHTMDQFVQYYNHQEADNIAHMWTPAETFLWNNERMKEMHEKYGTITAFKFLGVDKTDPNQVWVFLTQFSKAGKKTTSLTLDANKHLGTFRFITSSPGITKMKEAANK